MSAYRVFVSQEFSQPVEEIFSLLADHEQLGQVLGAPVKRIRDGEDAPNGVGSVRRIGPWPVGVQETVTALKQNEEIEYVISRFGGPVRNHRGRLQFRPTSSGSRLEWTIEFDSLPLLGSAIEMTLDKAIQRGLRKLG